MHEVTIKDVNIGKGRPLALIAGPCVLEELSVVMEIAQELKKICKDLDIPLIFKASYEKDNRGSEKSYRGPGLREGLRMLDMIKERYDLPVLSDVHRVEDMKEAAKVLDVIQIPAYLCQQTSLLLEAGNTGKPINVKKGQFLSPENMKSAIGKINSTGNYQILLTERGTCFGYNRLIFDVRSIPIMQSLGYPVVLDPTHIVRLYGLPSDDPRGGEPQFIPYLTLAGVAAGCDALFLETHPRPSEGKCDAASMLSLEKLAPLLRKAKEIKKFIWS